MAERSIELTAARLRWTVFVVWAVILLGYVAGRFGVDSGAFQVHARTDGAEAGTLLLVADISAVLITGALFQLGRMLSAISAGELFTARVTASFRAFALWLLLVALAWILVPTAATLMSGPGDDNALHFSLQLRDLLTLGIALILFLVARLLEQAQLIEHENREIV